ncbi:MAG: glycosyltransferase [Chloroflexi bacterium]|nr:glycosyltransferase [Chloroflexota bacterium]
MIVKNEEANLRPCLESMGDLPSEIIIVDTGSTDNTVAAARELGAKVHFYEWTADFSAARNESLKHATGDWVLWADADDRLDPKAVAQLKWALQSGIADSYSCDVCSQRNEGGEDVTEHLRMFRNGLGIRFEGAVHESPVPDIVRLGLKMARTGIRIEHVGYHSAQATHEKGKRNLAIVERQLAERPDDVDLLFYRGQCHGITGNLDQCVADMRDFLARTQPHPMVEWKRIWAYIAQVRVLDHKKQRDQLEPVLRDALAEFPTDPHFLVLQARLLAAKGRPEEALAQLDKARTALKKPVRGFCPPESWIEFTTAECFQALGQTKEAILWARRALEHSPDLADASLLLARLCVQTGRLDEADSLVQQMVPSSGGRLLLAEIRFRQSRVEEALQAVQEAQEAGMPAEQAEALRTRILVAQKQAEGIELMGKADLLSAAESFADAIQLAPEDPANYRYLAAALRKMGREQEALEAWQLATQWQSRAGSETERAPASVLR